MELTSLDGVKCVTEAGVDGDGDIGFTWVLEGAGFLLKSCFMDSLNLGFTLDSGVGSGAGSGMGLIFALS